MKKYEIEMANAYYTGGGIYIYRGKLKDGRFIVGSSEWDAFYFTDSDPTEYSEEYGDEVGYYNEWLDKHVVETIEDKDYKQFLNDFLHWIIQRDTEGNYLIGDLEWILKQENLPLYPDYIMRNVRQSLDLEPDDTSRDEEINEMDKEEVLEKFWQWEGIIGYTSKILSSVEDIYGYGKR